MAEWDYTGEGKIVIPSITLRDMFWDGTNWWAVNDISKEVFKCDSNWNFLDIWHYVGEQTERPTSIFYDGTNWWVLGYIERTVYKYDSNWNYTGSSYYVGNQGSILKIFYDGVNWWTVGTNDYIYKYDSNWNYTGSSYYVGNQDVTPIDIFYDGVNWWMAGQSTGTIYKYDSNWNYTGVSYYVGNQAEYPSSIFYDGVNWWMLGTPFASGTSIYKYFGPTTITTTLTIDTSPVKGEVFVDSVSWGIAPQTREINAGNYIISFGEIAGYENPASIEINLAEGETKQIIGEYVEIPPEKSFINVKSNPTGANIYLDNNQIGSTNSSYEIDPGSHTLKLTLDEYYDSEETFSISEGETKTFNITLNPIIEPGKKFPYWIFLLGIPLLFPLLKKKFKKKKK